MPKYNLDALGSQEFEKLSQALIQKIIGPGAKVYGMGKDGSREATFQGKASYPSKVEQWEGSWIFQAKFHDVQQIGPKEARKHLLLEIDDELSKITEKYKHPCDNFILITNVTLTPVFQRGIKDKVDNEIIPKYQKVIKHIHVWAADEICRFLDDHPNIRDTYSNLLVPGDIIAYLLRATKREETDLDELIKLYSQGCFDHEQYAALDDAGDVEDKRIALQQVFIDLDTKPPSLPQDQKELERLPEWLKQAVVDEGEDEDEGRVSALSYLLDDSIPGLVLIGGPGEGKSTLGQYLVQIHRARLIERLHELGENIEEFEKCTPRVPFRILLREYAQWITSHTKSDSLFIYLAEEISRESGKETNSEIIHKIVKFNPILLILDGLDEVPNKKLRTKVLDNITSFVNQTRNVLKGNLRIIATTRPYGYSEEFDPFHYLHLNFQTLSSEKAIKYTKLWTDAREPNPREAERIRKTFSMCLEDKVVSVLTKTPLQVTILLVIIRARGTPPKQREELFERYMDIIYQREQKKHPELLRTEQDVIYGLHKYLAYLLHRRAKKDWTTALMNVSEFKDRVQEYLEHNNPLLDKKEVETKVNQIVTEASERLILIESPEEGKVGFGLTTMREFFAAAHLVDTATDTAKRDLRFKAIARTPHWRNVALFFAGRVGRTRPGEAPSMIDVCREIDTESVDKFLKRGAELTMEVVNDRVLREPHNEVGAVQYGLTLIDKGFIKDFGDVLKILKNLPVAYKERVVRPWMEERLKDVIPDNLKLYVDIHLELFGMHELLKNAIKRASECDSEDVKLWALNVAIKIGIKEFWVIELLEVLVNNMPIGKILRAVSDDWSNFGFYIKFPLSTKSRMVISLALLTGVEYETHYYSAPRSRSIRNIISKLSKFKLEGKIKINLLLFWAIIHIIKMIYTLSTVGTWHRQQKSVNIFFPKIVSFNIKSYVSRNSSFFRDFCNVFSKEKDSFTDYLVAFFEFLLEPHSFEKFMDVSKQLHAKNETFKQISRPISSLIGLLHEEAKLPEFYKDLYTLYKYYKNEDQYQKDFEELNKLIDKDSNVLTYHPQRLYLWTKSNCDPALERYLDPEILIDIKNWCKYRNLSEKFLCYCGWGYTIKRDLGLLEFGLETIERQFAKGQKRLETDVLADWYEWRQSKSAPELLLAKRLKQFFEKYLTKYSTLIDPSHYNLESIFWTALSAGVVEEEHMIKLYKIVCNNPNFPFSVWHAEGAMNAQPLLENMLKSEKIEVTRLAAVSLSTIYQRIYLEGKELKKDAWTGNKYWEFSKDKKDIWHSRYIAGMAHCQLKWEEKGNEIFEAIKQANTEELQYAWCNVIRMGGYCDDKDQKGFLDLHLRILESEDLFVKSISIAALQRLNEMTQDIETEEFEEELLGLPLSRR